VLPVAYLTSEVISGAGGLAAAMALGVFAGQILPSSISGSEARRRRNTAAGGLIAIGVMIGLFLLSNSAR
jgi:hypothetical protein